VRKTASFFEFSLCLSRACLGKMIVFIYKLLKNAVFAGRMDCGMPVARRSTLGLVPPMRHLLPRVVVGTVAVV
jgi:hypothetical protein